jgi:hypothetical protein
VVRAAGGGLVSSHGRSKAPGLLARSGSTATESQFQAHRPGKRESDHPVRAVITRACPLACLASVLSRVTYEALVAGIEASPATVGDVAELCEQGKLTDLPGIASGRLGEISRCLVALELVEPEGGEAIWLVRREHLVVKHGAGCAYS